MITPQARDSEKGPGLRFHLLACDKGSAIYHEGDRAHHWYEVVSGIVRTCRFMADGHRQLTGFFYPQDVFGVEEAVHRESAEAVTDVLLRRYFAGPLDDREAPSDDVHDKVLLRALESARQSIFLFGHRTAASRLAAFLIAVAERSGRSAGLELPMTRSDIADHLNLTLHTVSRTISDFARKGLIAFDGPQNVQILNLENLRILAGEADEEDGSSAGPTSSSWEARLCETAS